MGQFAHLGLGVQRALRHGALRERAGNLHKRVVEGVGARGRAVGHLRRRQRRRHGGHQPTRQEEPEKPEEHTNTTHALLLGGWPQNVAYNTI
ncbi:hypothetical protein D3C71_1794520 [compost metagenome]